MTGQITREAFTHPQRNIITKVMGTDKRVSQIYLQNDLIIMTL